MRTPKPWYWDERKAYYATVDGVRHRLCTTERGAQQALKQLLARPKRKQTSSGFVIQIVDDFLDFIQRRAARTYEFYERHLKAFAKSIPVSLQTDDLKTHHIQS
jgi:hypothetical protein